MIKSKVFSPEEFRIKELATVLLSISKYITIVIAINSPLE